MYTKPLPKSAILTTIDANACFLEIGYSRQRINLKFQKFQPFVTGRQAQNTYWWRVVNEKVDVTYLIYELCTAMVMTTGHVTVSNCQILTGQYVKQP